MANFTFRGMEIGILKNHVPVKAIITVLLVILAAQIK